MISAMAHNDSKSRYHLTCSTGLGVMSALRSTSLYSDERVVVACDAEIYDENPVRENSITSGTDTGPAARIAELYSRYGEKVLDKLTGVFSVAIWDDQEQKLLLARDRLGIRTLCYAELQRGLIFASYPVGVLASRLIPTVVDSHAVVDYLNFNVVPAPKTAYHGISKLRPGEYLVWQRGQSRKVRY